MYFGLVRTVFEVVGLVECFYFEGGEGHEEFFGEEE